MFFISAVTNPEPVLLSSHKDKIDFIIVTNRVNSL